MTDVMREESETGKYSTWVHIKNWISDYLKPTDLNIDGNKNVGVNVMNHLVDFPDAYAGTLLDLIATLIDELVAFSDLNIDGNKNVGVNVKTVTEEDPDAATKNNPISTYSYNGDGQLTHIAITFNVTIWVKTITYASGRISAISGWVKQ